MRIMAFVWHLWIRVCEGVALRMGCDGGTCGLGVREIVAHVDKGVALAD
jgi:hypothetical protein